MSESGRPEGSRQVRDISVQRVARHEVDSKVRVSKPEYFYGDRNKVDDWFNQLLLYFRMEGITGADQPLIAVSYLRGDAQHWARPKLSTKLLRNEDPDGLFTDFQGFVRNVRAIYGISNEKQSAIRSIQHITQKGSASQYTAKFKECQGKTGWDNNSLCTMYYRGLKDIVKDELVRQKVNQTSSLEELMRSAIDIDDRLYERSMEKRHSGQFRGRTGFASNSWSEGQQRRDPDAMEIDNINRHPKKGRNGGTKGQMNQKGKKREGPECYACHKKGHYARDCRGSKVRPQQARAHKGSLEVNVMTRENGSPNEIMTRGAYDTTGVQEDPDHATEHWTFCYKDYCVIHYSAKVDAGWFPSKPRNKEKQELNVMIKVKSPYEMGGDECLSDKCQQHRDRKSQSRYHYMLSYEACSRQECDVRHIGMADGPLPRMTGWINLKEEEHSLRRGIEELGIEGSSQSPQDREAATNEVLEALQDEWRALEIIEDWSTEEQEQAARVIQGLVGIKDSLRRLKTEYRIRTERPDTRVREFNMMSARQPQQQQRRDHGNRPRGRSPPPMSREETTLQENQEPAGDQDADVPPLQLSRVHAFYQIPTGNTPLEQPTSEMRETPEPTTPSDEDYSQAIQDAESLPDNSDAMDDSTPEMTDEEYCENCLPDDMALMTFTVEGPVPVHRMVTHIANNFEMTFPRVNGQRRLNVREFDNMLAQLRVMFWNYRLLEASYDAGHSVQELVPIGSTFDEIGGYMAPDGIIISRAMRERITNLGLRFNEVQRIQQAYLDDEYDLEEMRKRISTSIRQWHITPETPPGPPTPVWRGMILGHLRTQVRGRVRITQTEGRTVITPMDGTLSWDIIMEDARGHPHLPKN